MNPNADQLWRAPRWTLAALLAILGMLGPFSIDTYIPAFSGIAKVGRKEEWPSWTPTNDIKKRLGNIPAYVAPGPHNPMGSRALYVYEGNKDTLYRIHGTNQPEYIGSAISSGCIRLTNEDAIDLFNRVKINTTVVVLAPGQGDSPTNPRLAFTGGRDVN